MTPDRFHPPSLYHLSKGLVVATVLVFSASGFFMFYWLGFPIGESIFLSTNVLAGATPLSVSEYLVKLRPEASSASISWLRGLLVLLRVLGWLIVPSAFATLLAVHFQNLELARHARLTQKVELLSDAARVSGMPKEYVKVFTDAAARMFND